MRTEVFATRESWQNYAVNALQIVERLAEGGARHGPVLAIEIQGTRGVR